MKLNNASCINKYRDLEEYVLYSKVVMDNLTETFFKTGKPFTEYVKITYIIKISMSSSSSNITNNYTTAYYEDTDDNNNDEYKFNNVRETF